MKTSTFMAVCCSLVLVLCTLAWPALRISSAKIRGERDALAQFQQLRTQADSLLDKNTADGSQRWNAAVRTAWSGSVNLLAVFLLDELGKPLYALPATSPFYTNSTVESIPSLAFSAPRFSTLQASAWLPSGMRLEALYTTVSRETVFRTLMETLLGLLLVSLVAALVLLFNPRKPVQIEPIIDGDTAAEPEPASPPVTVPPAEPQPAAQQVIAPQVIAPQVTAQQVTAPRAGSQPAALQLSSTTDTATEAVTDTATVSPAVELAYESRAESDTPLYESAPEDDGLTIADPDPALVLDRLNNPETRTDDQNATGTAEAVSVGRKKIPVDEQTFSGPNGLYDPVSGLCWESYLRERLGAELRRAASFEQDLVLLLANWDTARKGSADYEIFVSTIRDFFNFPDLSFNFTDNGVAVVLPNMDIDHALRETEELIKKLMFRLQGGTDEELRYLELFIGLSSRSGRIVDSDRLVAETLVALKKARSERDTHIMAFRPDPEKFRSYLINR